MQEQDFVRKMAASLLPHVKDPQVAAELIRTAGNLPGQVALSTRIDGPDAARFAKGRVQVALTAVAACDDPELLDRFARDQRLSVKRTVAASPWISSSTVDLLFEFAVKNGDAEVFSPLLSRLAPEQLAEQISDGQAAGASDQASDRMLRLCRLLACSEEQHLMSLFGRVVAAGDLRSFAALSQVENTRSYTRRSLRTVAAQALGGTVRGHGGLDVRDVLDLAPDIRVPLEYLVEGFRFIDVARVGWASELAFGSASTFPLVNSLSADFRSYNWKPLAAVDVDDEAADALVELFQGADDLTPVGRFLRRRMLAQVASDPAQADRKFDALLSAGPDAVANMTVNLSRSDRLTGARQAALVGPLVSGGLVTVEGVAPEGFAEELGFEHQLPLIRSGGMLPTLAWLCGHRFSEPTIDRVLELLSDPGEAFASPLMGLRAFLGRDRYMALWHQLASPSPARNQLGTVDWLLGARETLDQLVADDVSEQVAADAADLTGTLSDRLLVLAVEAAGADGVKAALKHPAWLEGFLAGTVGYDIRVWDALLRLLPDWGQSLFELVETAASLAGVDVSDRLEAYTGTGDPADGEVPADAAATGEAAGGLSSVQLPLL